MSETILKPILTQQQKTQLDFALQAVMLHLYNQFPFWALLIERCTIVASLDVPRAGITKNNTIVINPEWFLGINFYQRLFVMAHEVGHAAFKFFDRLQNRDLRLFNEAQDYLINYLLRNDFESSKYSKKPFWIPDSLYSPYVGDLTSEDIYEMLWQLRNPGASSRGSRLAKEHPDLWNDLKQQTQQFSDVLKEDPKTTETIRPNRAQTPKNNKEWDEAVNRAYVSAKQQGRMPAALERFLEQFCEPRVHWTKQFTSSLTTAATRDDFIDYSWLSPNRRQSVLGNIVIPGPVGGKKKAVFAVDTSGSMYAACQIDNGSPEPRTYMDQAISEVEYIRKDHNLRVYLLNCDADVHRAEWIEPYEDLPSLIGGGGTSFVPIFEHIEKENLNPDFVVVLTDGYGDYPPDPPPYDVIWVIFGEYQPPFGEVIRVDT
ncbi:MAG: hypothetical protein D6698_17350 [Gammaproteobacteria bacterium]|nr:MAG: hypothetical protein D6698_17350 [Gammaproteobacteria bacterium]